SLPSDVRDRLGDGRRYAVPLALQRARRRAAAPVRLHWSRDRHHAGRRRAVVGTGTLQPPFAPRRDPLALAVRVVLLSGAVGAGARPALVASFARRSPSGPEAARRSPDRKRRPRTPRSSATAPGSVVCAVVSNYPLKIAASRSMDESALAAFLAASTPSR